MNRGSIRLIELVAPGVLHHFTGLARQVAALVTRGHDHKGVFPASGEVMSFVAQGREGHSPTVPFRADQVVGFDPRLVEEGLIEFASPVHLPDRSHLNPGLVDIDDEEGQTSVFWHVRICPGQKNPPVGRQRPRVPDLLPVHQPAVPVTDGLRPDAGQIRSGIGLAEELAPTLLSCGECRKPPGALILGTVNEKDGGGHGRSHPDGRSQHPSGGHFPSDRRGFQTGHRLSEPLGRPVRKPEPALGQPSPPLPDSDVGIPRLGQPATDRPTKFLFRHAHSSAS